MQRGQEKSPNFMNLFITAGYHLELCWVKAKKHRENFFLISENSLFFAIYVLSSTCRTLYMGQNEQETLFADRLGYMRMI